MKKRDLADSYWKNHYDRWEYAMDHYTGDYAIRELYGGKISHYLKQKYQRENNKAFEERKEVTDPVLHFATIVDSINGVMASKQDQTKRDFGAFGDPMENGTDADRLWNNADGNGTNWEPFFKRVGIKLTILGEMWGYVKGVTDESEPCIVAIDPRNVVNRWPISGDPQQVLICEKMDLRRSMNDDGDSDAEVYTLFTLDGYYQYTYKDGEKVFLDEGEYTFWSDSTRTKRILPIFRSYIPMPRNVGYLLSVKENHIFNQESVRDFALRNMSFALLKLGVKGKDEYNHIVSTLEKGANVIAQYEGAPDHTFISPDSAYLAQSQEILSKKIEDFYINGFKKYGDTAKQVTATQIKLESQSGIESYLSLLVDTVDEFENQSLFRLEQVYYPNQPANWGLAYVERSHSFQPEELPDPKALAEIAVNMERTRAVSKETIVRTLHPTWTDEEIADELLRLNREQGASPLPPQLIE